MVAFATTQHVMYTDTVSNFDSRDLIAQLFNYTSNFMPKSSGQWMYRRFASSIVYVGMANPSGLYAHQNVIFANYWHGDILLLEGTLDLDKADSFHGIVLLRCLRCNYISFHFGLYTKQMLLYASKMIMRHE